MRTGLSRKTSWESRERHPKEKRLFPRRAGSSLGLLGTGRSRWSRRPSEKRAQSHCFPNLRPPETQAHLPWKLLSHLDPFWVDAQETFCSFSSGKGDVPTRPPTWTGIGACAAGPSSRAFPAPGSEPVRAHAGVAPSRSAPWSPRPRSDAEATASPQPRRPVSAPHTLTPLAHGAEADTARPRKWGFPGGAVVKNRLPMQGTQVRALIQEDPTCCGATKPVCHDY
ncbi:hypothetical protein J1605_011508 [Eschrichtius robustus]|uniref:Uncharacterized protein n=1 Tax=Eschrichtius robustus TaxID=9764 RepID=A0AB34GMT1_ESCRO|nr:hypothetical protein J1605_011508 [Eschrichtius robustus]